MGELNNEKKPLNPIILIWENLEVAICVLCMLALTIITFSNVTLRYIFGSSIKWGEEVCGYLLIWLTFGGSAYAFRRGSHIGIESFVDKLSPKKKYVVTIINMVLVIVFFIMVGYVGFNYAVKQFAQLTPVTRTSMAVPISALPFGAVMVIARIIYQIVEEIKSGPKEG